MYAPSILGPLQVSIDPRSEREERFGRHDEGLHLSPSRRYSLSANSLRLLCVGYRWLTGVLAQRTSNRMPEGQTFLFARHLRQSLL